MADSKTPIRYINGHPVADQEARDRIAGIREYPDAETNSVLISGEDCEVKWRKERMADLRGGEITVNSADDSGMIEGKYAVTSSDIDIMGSLAICSDIGDYAPIMWDGKEYDATVTKIDQATAYGNQAVVDESAPDTGEPFCIIKALTEAYIVVVFAEAGEHTLAMPTARPLDEKYVPRTIARQAEVDKLSEEMANKISGPVEILSFDGDPTGRDTFEMPFMEGAALTFVKISDSVFTADDLAPAIMAVAGADSIELPPETTVYPDEVFEISGSYFVAVGGMPQIVSTANKRISLEDGSELSIPSSGTYCVYVPEGGLDVLIGAEGSAPVYMTSYFKIDLIHESMLPNIPADKLPCISSDMLPSIPADKLPDGLVRYARLTVTVGSTTVDELMAAINPYSSDLENGTLFQLIVKDGDTTYVLQTTRMYVERVYDSHSSYEFSAPILLTKSGYMAEQMLRKITLYFTDGIISSVGLVYPTSIRIGSYDITVNNGTLTATKAT